MLCPLSCRWRSDWLPCHPASQSLTSMPACFSSFVAHRPAARSAFCRGQCYERVLVGHLVSDSVRAISAVGRNMRRRWRISIRWKRKFRRLFSAEQDRSSTSSRQSVTFDHEYQGDDTQRDIKHGCENRKPDLTPNEVSRKPDLTPNEVSTQTGSAPQRSINASNMTAKTGNRVGPI